jgi:hypothetical protein
MNVIIYFMINSFVSKFMIIIIFAIIFRLILIMIKLNFIITIINIIPKFIGFKLIQNFVIPFTDFKYFSFDFSHNYLKFVAKVIIFNKINFILKFKIIH